MRNINKGLFNFIFFLNFKRIFLFLNKKLTRIKKRIIIRNHKRNKNNKII